jgi:hypothetical protein
MASVVTLANENENQFFWNLLEAGQQGGRAWDACGRMFVKKITWQFF